MCVCVCVPVRENVSETTCAIFTNFLCLLPMAIARSSSSRVMKSEKKGAIWGGFFPIGNSLYGPYNGINFLMKDRRTDYA